MSSELRRQIVIYGCLTLLTIATYGQVGTMGFVNLDDPGYVSGNLRVRQGLTWENVRWAFTTGAEANWHPLTWLSHLFDVQLFGVERPGSHHLVNLLFHLANTLLLFGLLHRATAAVWPSALVAALFAVHPLHVESVAWVSERKDLLSAFFGLLATRSYVRYAQKPSIRRYALVFLLLTLGLMAKPMLVTLPCVFLLLDYWPLERLRLGRKETEGLPPVGLVAGSRLLEPTVDSMDAQKSSRAGRKPARGRVAKHVRQASQPSTSRSTAAGLLVEKLPLFGLSALSSIVTFLVQQHGGAVEPMEAIGWGIRVDNALLAYVKYIGMMFWPCGLSPYYPLHLTHNALSVMGAAMLLAALSVAVAWGTWRGRRYLAVGWLWYLGMLVPVIGLVQVGNQALADRYTYLPMIGLFGLLAWGAAELNDRFPVLPRILVPMVVGILLVCSTIAARQAGYWSDSIALFERALTVEESSLAHLNLGMALAEREAADAARGPTDKTQEMKQKAIGHYREALRLNPRFVQAHNNLGLALSDQGRMEEAVAHYLAALEVNPRYAKAHNNLGRELASGGHWAEAIEHYSTALAIQPDYPKAHNNMALALEAQGRVEEAVQHYREALRLQPDYAKARRNLERALRKRQCWRPPQSARGSRGFPTSSERPHWSWSSSLNSAGVPNQVGRLLSSADSG